MNSIPFLTTFARSGFCPVLRKERPPAQLSALPPALRDDVEEEKEEEEEAELEGRKEGGRSLRGSDKTAMNEAMNGRFPRHCSAACAAQRFSSLEKPTSEENPGWDAIQLHNQNPHQNL